MAYDPTLIMTMPPRARTIDPMRVTRRIVAPRRDNDDHCGGCAVIASYARGHDYRLVCYARYATRCAKSALRQRRARVYTQRFGAFTQMPDDH